MNGPFRPHGTVALTGALVAGLAACAPAIVRQSINPCVQVDSATAVRLANAVFTDLDPEAATFARTKYHRSQTTPESFELRTFERDHLGAWVHLSPGFDLGGDSMFRVTGCGCAQVVRDDDTATTTMVLSGPSFLRSHFHFLPPDSALAVELARDAMLATDIIVNDSLETTADWGRTVGSGLGMMKLAKKYIFYNVVEYGPDAAGVIIRLAPTRPGWAAGGQVRVTGGGCVAYRWTGV